MDLIKGTILITCLTFAGCKAFSETYHKSQPSNPIDKATAMIESINHPGTVIYKCAPVALTKKMTFKNIPTTGANDFLATPAGTGK